MRFDEGESSRAWFAVEKLDVFEAAVELTQLCDGLRARLWRRNPALCRQLERAVASIVANIGEGAACFTAGDRRRYYEYGYRSAGESAAILIAFRSIETLTTAEYDKAATLLHRIQMMLQRMMQKTARAGRAPPR